MPRTKDQEPIDPADLMEEGATYFTKSTAQVDLERRQALEDGGTAAVVGEPRSFAVEDNDTEPYIGVAGEYQTYGDPTQRPLAAESGPEARVEAAFKEALAVPKEGVVSESVVSDEAEVDAAPVTDSTSAAAPEPNQPAKD